jgi:hypothetical protein
MVDALRGKVREMKTIYATIAVGIALTSTPTFAQAPVFHWGSDTRAMSQPECMKRAKFAIGEVGMQVNGETGQDVSGASADAAVLVTCLAFGDRTFISVVGSSLDSAKAEAARNSVRSITMGPAD